MTDIVTATPLRAASVPGDPIAAYRRAVRKRLLLTAALVLAIVFSEDGIVRRVLRMRFFVWLGTISYSIYMSHSALLWLFNQVHRFFFQRSEILIEGRMVPQLGFWQALLSYLIIIGLLLAVSHLVYRYVEQPWRERSRRTALKMPALPFGVRSIK